MQAELDAVKAAIQGVADAMATLENARLVAHATIDLNIAAMGKQIAEDTLRPTRPQPEGEAQKA